MTITLDKKKGYDVSIKLEVSAKDTDEALLFALEDINELSKSGMVDAKITEVSQVIPDISLIVNQAVIYMITHHNGMGFTSDGQEDMDGLILEDIPAFITELQDAKVLPQNNRYVQYAVGALTKDEKRQGETEKKAKFIVFDEQDNILSVIPQERVLAFQEKWFDSELRRGLKREGLERLIRALI